MGRIIPLSQHFRKFKHPDLFLRSKFRRKFYRFFRKISSSFREQKRQKSSWYFIWKKKCHYTKDCPNKKDKAIRSMSGFIILLWAPVSRSPMAGIGLWNLEGKMWSFMEGIGMVVSRDKSCWWKQSETHYFHNHRWVWQCEHCFISGRLLFWEIKLNFIFVRTSLTHKSITTVCSKKF